METNTTGYEYALTLIAECKRTKSKKLDLGCCGLKEIPEAVFELTHLEELYLYDIYWNKYEWIWMKSKNEGVSNQLCELPDGLGRLKNLKILFVIGHLFNGSAISDISVLENLIQLNTLHLGNNSIQDISSIQTLTNLNYLSLSANNITDISFIQTLTKLNYLDLSANNITDISFIQTLTKLNHLDLSANKKIKNFSFIQTLTNLNYLNLSANNITDISFIQTLTKLNHLDLNINNIQDISFIERLPKLEKFAFAQNQLSIFPLSLLVHPTLKYLRINHNSLTSIPDEILEGIQLIENNNALPDLRQWFADLAKGSIPNYQFKLLILGNGRVGKSCLVDALQGRPFDKNKESSHAIILERWPQEVPEASTEPQYFIWDFGGQEIYHSTHKWFMRSRAVYLVVWERDSEKQAKVADPITGLNLDNHDIPYWINTIRANNKDIPILLVETKLDRYEHRPKQLSEKELPPKFRTNLEFARFSAADPKRYLRRLKNDILMITEGMEEYGQEMPLSWHRVRSRILDCLFTANKKVTQRKLSVEEFKTWCTEAEVLPKSSAALLRFLHRTGIVYTDKKLLGDTILLDQQWAIDAIYKVLDRHSSFFEDTYEDRKGKFKQRHLFSEWGDDYSAADRQLFLQFMLSCKLCFRVDEKDEGRNTQYAIPQLMPEQSPPRVKDTWTTTLPEVHYLEFQYDFLHYATVQDFIVAMGRKTHLDYIWKNGIAFPYQDSAALMTAHVPEKIIHIRTRGGHRAFLLSAIQNAFLEKVDRDLQPKIRVSNDGLHFVDLADLKKQHALENDRIEGVNRKTLATLPLLVADFVWALQRDEKADLKSLPEHPPIIEAPKQPVKVVASEQGANEFIHTPDKPDRPVKKVIETTTRELIYVDEEEDNRLKGIQQGVEQLQKGQFLLFEKMDAVGSKILLELDASDRQLVLDIQKAIDTRPMDAAVIAEINTTITNTLQGLESQLTEIPDFIKDWKALQAKNEKTKLDPKVKLKCSIPLLPWFLKYEAELNVDLRKSLKENWAAFRSGELFREEG